MKKSVFITSLIGLTMPCLAFSSSLDGKWCVVDDPQECVVISQQGELAKAVFFHGNTKTVNLVGFQRGNAISMSFLNSKGEIGTWSATSNTTNRLSATCLNPDGSLRWKAVYSKK